MRRGAGCDNLEDKQIQLPMGRYERTKGWLTHTIISLSVDDNRFIFLRKSPVLMYSTQL